MSQVEVRQLVKEYKRRKIKYIGRKNDFFPKFNKTIFVKYFIYLYFKV